MPLLGNVLLYAEMYSLHLYTSTVNKYIFYVHFTISYVQGKFLRKLLKNDKYPIDLCYVTYKFNVHLCNARAGHWRCMCSRQTDSHIFTGVFGIDCRTIECRL